MPGRIGPQDDFAAQVKNAFLLACSSPEDGKACLLATLNCSSARGGPIVAQNKMPKSVAEKIMTAISLKYIGPTPH